MTAQALERSLEASSPTLRSREELLSICKRGQLSDSVWRIIDSYQTAVVSDCLLPDTSRDDSVSAFLAAMLCVSVNALQISVPNILQLIKGGQREEVTTRVMQRTQQLIQGTPHSAVLEYGGRTSQDIAPILHNILDQALECHDMSAFEAEGRPWPEPAHVEIHFTDLPSLARQEGRLDHPLTLVSPVLLVAYILLPPVAQYSVLFSLSLLYSTDPLAHSQFCDCLHQMAVTLQCKELETTIFRPFTCSSTTGLLASTKVVNRALHAATACCALASAVLLLVQHEATPGNLCPANVEHAEFEWITALVRAQLKLRVCKLELTTSSAPPTYSKGSASDGIKYLVAQQTARSSAYKMPAISPSPCQQAFEDWFSKLKSFAEYYDISESAIVHAVSSHLPNTHHAIFGWSDIVSNLRLSQQSITLQRFFAHVRKQLFVCSNTRETAYAELLSLAQSSRSMADCNAFVTKLKQIWSRLFPSQSTEREPVLQYDACLEIHRVMKELHRTSFRNRKTAFLLAFCEEDFHSADLFRDYLCESQHTYATDSHIACAQYLNSLYAHLEETQMMYNTQYKTQPSTTDGASHQTLTAHTSVPRRTKKPLRSSTGTTHAEHNSQIRDRSSSDKRARSKSQTHPFSNESKKQRSGQVCMTPVSAKVERMLHRSYQLDSLANMAGVDITLEDAIQLGSKGTCCMCKNPISTHSPRGMPGCPVVKALAMNTQQTFKGLYTLRNQQRKSLHKMVSMQDAQSTRNAPHAGGPSTSQGVGATGRPNNAK